MESQLNPTKRYALEEAIDFVMNTSTAESVLSNEPHESVLSGELREYVLSDEPRESVLSYEPQERVESVDAKMDEEDEADLKLFSISRIYKMFSEANEMVKNVTEIISTPALKYNDRIPQKDISNIVNDNSDGSGHKLYYETFYQSDDEDQNEIRTDGNDNVEVQRIVDGDLGEVNGKLVENGNGNEMEMMA